MNHVEAQKVLSHNNLCLKPRLDDYILRNSKKRIRIPDFELIDAFKIKERKWMMAEGAKEEKAIDAIRPNTTILQFGSVQI